MIPTTREAAPNPAPPPDPLVMDQLIVAEHDRIARDLHDTVIQRLFGIAMRLESVLPLAQHPVAERIDEAVEGLDAAVRDIRTAIFGLQHRRDATVGLRGMLLGEVDDAAELLGFPPRLAFVGPLELLVPRSLWPTLVDVLRESLSNVIRHARASAVEVEVRVEDDVCVTVADDGIGLPTLTPSDGLGLANLAARARQLDGHIDVGAGPDGGTVLRWSVPLPGSGQAG